MRRLSVVSFELGLVLFVAGLVFIEVLNIALGIGWDRALESARPQRESRQDPRFPWTKRTGT